jgi:isopenicillin N synthase-like dioxygenase
MSALPENIPVVDLRDHAAGGPARAAFVSALGRGLERWGFVAVTHHGVPDDLLSEAYGVAARVFALPAAAKLACERPATGRQRGYTPFEIEKAKDQAVPDAKEFWHIGRELPAGYRGDIPENVFPAELPDFARTMRALYAAQEAFALKLLTSVGAFLGLPDGFFDRMAGEGNSVLRVIHYPDPPGGKAAPGQVRAAAHEDINLMTVLPAATRPGLEILTREGEWLAVATPPGCLICDTGDMMQYLTGGRMPATTHRVVNPPEGGDGGRYSMPFFLHPAPEAVLSPITGGAPPVRAHDFLMQRLRENGVM